MFFKSSLVDEVMYFGSSSRFRNLEGLKNDLNRKTPDKSPEKSKDWFKASGEKCPGQKYNGKWSLNMKITSEKRTSGLLWTRVLSKWPSLKSREIASRSINWPQISLNLLIKLKKSFVKFRFFNVYLWFNQDQEQRALVIFTMEFEPPFLLIILISLLALIFLAWKGLKREHEEYPYLKKDNLFSDAECSFFRVLEQAVGDKFCIFAKVRIADVLNVRRMNDTKKWWRAFNKISSKHFDYVLCSKQSFSNLAGIELNDNSHQNKKRKTRDTFLVKACQAADFPLIQITARKGYSPKNIREQIVSALQLQDDSILLPGDQLDDSKKKGEAVSKNSPVCPKCSAPMVRCRVKSGQNSGKEFLGCSQFPQCRGVMTIKNV